MVIRDKIITLRVNKKIYERVLGIIENNTRTYETRATRCSFNELKGKYSQGLKYYRKFSVGDLLEIAMNEFIRDNE